MTNWPYSSYSKINIEAARHFPFGEARQHQLETISEIKEAIDKGYKYIILEAGTGTGKSAIAATLASMYDMSYILTVTKQLQDQYINDFKELGFKLVKGRGNFGCRKYEEEGIDLKCDNGRCVVEGYPCKYSLKHHADEAITEDNTCHYFYQKFLAMTAPVAISNYPYMFLELNYVDDFHNRTLLICDEAHNIEGMIMSQLTLEFDRNDLKEYIRLDLTDEMIEQLEAGDYSDWIDFISKVKVSYELELDKIIGIRNRPELNEKIAFMKRQINDCKNCMYYIDFDPEMWIFDYDEDNQKVQFKPLKINNYAKSTFFKYADVCIFMSATILDYRLFAHWLGISPDEIYAIRQKSPFDVRRNPIITHDMFNMSRTHIDESAPKTIPAIKEILAKHENEKGIIHTVSGKCRDFLLDSIDDNRLIHHTTQNRAQIIEEFKRSDRPLVLVSPSVGEGVDLPGDECRFQVIYKIPFPDLGDKQTALRTYMDSKWYRYLTSLSMVQTYGRGMRYEEDYCTTYFIDSRFVKYVIDDGADTQFLPDTFRSAIDRLSDIPEDEATEYEDDLDFKQKVDIKYSLIKEGEGYLNASAYSDSIDFYRNLINHEYFKNDYYPYLKLAQAYEACGFFEDEVNVLTSFFSSGIYCTIPTRKKFKSRLKQLDSMGYFDYSMIENLEEEYQKKGFLNKALSGTPVPLAKRIVKMKRESKVPIRPDEGYPLLEAISKFGKDLSYDEKVEFKYRLVKMGEIFINNERYGEAIGFFNMLKKHELFENDYYPYYKLSYAYRKDGQFEEDERILIEFFNSGIYCNDKMLKWFKNRFRLLHKMGVFDNSQMYGLENEFYANGARNQALANTPIPSVDRLLKDRAPEENIGEVRKFIEFFNPLAKGTYKEKYNLKYDLAEMGRQLIRNKDLIEATAYYKCLMNHELFTNDYHPYLKLAKVYHKRKEYGKKDELIVEFLGSGIHCPGKVFNWFMDQLRRSAKKGNFNASQINDLMYGFFNNGSKNRKLSNIPVPIAKNLKK